MNSLSIFLNKLGRLFGRRRFRHELDEEMAFHRAQMERELVAAGMDAGHCAHHRAAVRFGNSARLGEQSSELVGFRAETVLQDLRYALRQLRKNPGFAFTAILILALGMGVSVATFGFVDAALLQPLPYHAPDRLMSVDERAVLWPRSNLSPRRLRRLEADESLLHIPRSLWRDGIFAALALRNRTGATPGV